MSDPFTRFKKATAEFWKDPELDATDVLLKLKFVREWYDFELDETGSTQYRGLYKDERIGVWLFQSVAGGRIAPHYHRFAERVMFVHGGGELILNRDYENPIRLDAENAVLIPAGVLHEGCNFVQEGDVPTMSLCVFYYEPEKRHP